MNIWKQFLVLAASSCLLVTGCDTRVGKQSAVDSALADFEAKRYDAALKTLQEAEKENPKDPFVLNLLGAAYTKKKDYTTARNYFEKSLDLEPGFFPARFNIGELFFLQKQYPQALEYFSRMYRENPGNELLQFKVILCLLMTDQMEDAQKMADRMPKLGESPAWYYSQAAISYKKGDKSKAAGLMRTARELFREKSSLYDETFDDLGWAR